MNCYNHPGREPVGSCVSCRPTFDTGEQQCLPANDRRAKKGSLTAWEYATTVKGFDPYDLRGA